MPINLQIIEDGEIIEEYEFEGMVGVGFSDVDENNVISRLLKEGQGASFVLGNLSAEDLVNASSITNHVVKDSLNDLGLSFDDFDIEIQQGE